MWLLGTKSLELTEFIGAVPRYAILSHTWGQDEVPFKAIRKDRTPYLGKKGYRKIQQACEQAVNDGFEWIWIDSVCIDKRSSAELTESINSMFKWYGAATVCYAYLEDVKAPQDGPIELKTLGKCRWFTRGWCLQELVSPAYIKFFATDWTIVGIKSSQSNPLISLLSKITGINRRCLMHPAEIKAVSVATRMSWAAARETTRPEDQAYSLMGLFNVNMPILYGEGLESAFERLQMEIINKSSDQSIFAWRADGIRPTQNYGLLAPTPSYFKDSQFEVVARSTRLRPFAMTNIGIQIKLRMSPVHTRKRAEPQSAPLLINPGGMQVYSSGGDSLWTASLRCWKWSPENPTADPQRVQIFLRERKTKISSGIRVFTRDFPQSFATEERTREAMDASELIEVCVPTPDQIIHLERTGAIRPTYSFNQKGVADHVLDGTEQIQMDSKGFFRVARSVSPAGWRASPTYECNLDADLDAELEGLLEEKLDPALQGDDNASDVSEEEDFIVRESRAIVSDEESWLTLQARTYGEETQQRRTIPDVVDEHLQKHKRNE